ncbi:MAG: hypothetical protein LBV16_04280 [Elusimicrobiota bacterium]|nr:hypothetical protein [Elusimicrobiota bacterium]
MKGIISVLFLISFAASIFAAESKKVIITGDILNIQKKGEVIISEGNSKAVSEDNTMLSKTMTYNKTSSLISAKGLVKIYMKNEEGEPLEAFGDYATYKTDTQLGALFGDLINIKYYMKDSQEPMLMNSKEVYFDGDKKNVKALVDVEIITTSGTIYSDNAYFYREGNSVIVKKDKKRPIADVIFEDKKGKFAADAMKIEKKDNIGSIKMRGRVIGKIKIDEEQAAQKDGLEKETQEDDSLKTDKEPLILDEIQIQEEIE